jgi:WD40 repeat protein
VSTIKLNSTINDFTFTVLEQRKKWWKNIKDKKKYLQKQTIVCASEIDVYTEQLNLFFINKKGKVKRKYFSKANGFYFDGRILIAKDKQCLYFLSNEKTIEKHSFPKLEFLKSYTVLPATKEDWLEKLVLLNSKEELLAFSKKGKAYYWNEQQQSILKTENTFDFVDYLDISSKDYYGISDGIFKIKLFSLQSGQTVTEIYNNSVNNSYKHIRNTLFASCDDEKIHIWDISRKRKKLNFNSLGSVNSIFKLNNFTVFTGSSEGLMTGFKKENHRYHCFFTLKISEHINHIAAFYEKEVCYLIVSCGDFVFDEKRIKIINLETQEIVSVFEDHTALIQKSERIPDSDYIVSISYDYTFRIWDYRNGTVFRTCFHTLNENFTGMSIGFELVNSYLITFSQEVVIIRNTINFDIIFEFPRYEVSIESYSLSDCKTFFATGYMNGDIKIWSLSERKELYTLSNKSNGLNKLYWKSVKNKKAKISTYILSTDDTYLFLWSLSNKVLVRKFNASNINDVVFYDGNRKFVTASSLGEVIIWNIYKEKELFKCNIGRAIMKVEIDEKERMIILGEHNGQIQFLKIQNEPKETIKIDKMF